MDGETMQKKVEDLERWIAKLPIGYISRKKIYGKDRIFFSLSEYEKKMVIERILEEVRGRMMEDIVLLETMKAAGRDCRVFRLQFAVGEFDMVVYDTVAKIWRPG